MRGPREEFCVEFLDHRSAGTGGDDDGFGVFQALQDAHGDRPRLIPIA